MFRAHDADRDRLVAIKVFRLDITPEQAAGLVRELDLLISRGIADPHVATPIAAGIDAHTPYLATDYIVGDSLDVIARRVERRDDRAPGSMPLREVVPIVDGMAAAIDACAADSVRHGMLHPRDVIVSADGPHITGFGIADALARIGLQTSPRRPYVAPEGVSDIYALAAIAFELISGRRMTPAGWDELSAEDGPDLRDAFAAALSPNPWERPERASEFAAKLRAAGRSAATPPQHESRPAAPGRILSYPAHVDTPVMLEPDPEFDTSALDRFADAGAASDLHLDFTAPAEPEVEIAHGAREVTPYDARDLAFVPTPALPADESIDADIPGEKGPGAKLLLLGLIAFLIAGAGAYAVKVRRSAPPAAVQTTPVKPPVESTTVELPPARPPAPASPAPAPAPSRQASGVVAAPPMARTTPTASAAGRLMIRSTPPDALVMLNGQSRGKTPVALKDLPLGSYTIHLTRNGFVAVDRRVQLTARRPSQSVAVSLKPLKDVAPASEASGAGSLSADSRPSGARVFLNDRLMGSTPIAIPDLPVGPVRVRIEKDGYQTWMTTVRVTAGQRARVAASLDRR